MPPKSDSSASKKAKKASDKDGGPNKKVKKTDADNTGTSKGGDAKKQEFTMTIPRKKDKSPLAADDFETPKVHRKSSKTPPSGEKQWNNKEEKELNESEKSPPKEEAKVEETQTEASPIASEKKFPTSKPESENESDNSSTNQKGNNPEADQPRSSPTIISKPEKETTPSGAGAPKPLKIDTTMIYEATNTNTGTPKGKSPQPTTGTAADTHPYARGSVIEVLHGVEDPTSDDWWSDDSDEETPAEQKKSSVRLCDVIDRVSIGDKKWRYYVHYRDFNRRMDEWVAMERILSPPSVGNAKARALKKEEEREKRKLQRLEEKNAELQYAAVDISAPRASRRRTSLVNNIPGTAPDATVAAEGDLETPRRTRFQRKRSFLDDDSTVVAGNTWIDSPHDVPPAVVAAEMGIVAISTTAATTTVGGEHVVATIPAQELDEHEGLDEASLREHEEVTKVKNVAFVELGPHQMEAWYFSPLPKELLSEKGFIEVLYVCEFTLSLFPRKIELQRFQARLPTHQRHPPGNEIYRNGNLSS
jgi:hypothetical protein